MNMLKTNNIMLRHPRVSDLEACYHQMNDKLIAEGMVAHPYPCSRVYVKDQLVRHIALNRKKRKEDEVFVIAYQGKLAGEIELSHIKPKLHAKVGYWIGKEFRGKGIATAALKLITQYAFQHYGLRRVDAYVRTYNKGSIRVLEKAGFKREGILRKHVLKNGKYYDDYVYAKVR